MNINRDHIGAIISGVCLVHCLAGPLLFIIGVTSVGHSFIEERDFHLAIFAPILFFAAWSIPNGIKTHHHPLPAVLTLLALFFLTLSFITVEIGMILSTFASCMLIFAHLYNRKLLTIINENHE